MRLRITLSCPAPFTIATDHQSELVGLTYALLGKEAPELAAFLHDDGFDAGLDGRNLKLFTYSPLRCAQRELKGHCVVLGPGRIEWLVSSVSREFITAVGEAAEKAGEVRIGHVTLSVEGVWQVPSPDFRSGRAAFTCVTPIVSAVMRTPEEGGGTKFLKPEDGALFSGQVRRNLLRKYQTIHGMPPADGRFAMMFDEDYLSRHRGTKMVNFRGINIIGAMAPFRAEGNPDLLRIGYECGFGEKNSIGFGMVDLQRMKAKD